MCRVILSNRADFVSYDRQFGILKLMNHLEEECGGHGNGYALLRDGKIIETRKGVKLTNEQIYKRIKGMAWDYLVYHTRIASIGGQGDANCHPFVEGNDCLAMNGTEHNLRTMSDAFGRTDTECIFRNIIGLGREQVTRALVEFNSVFIGCAEGKPFVVKAGGTLHRWNGGEKTLHASTFIKSVSNVQKISDGYVWDGKENLQFIKAARYDGWGSYSYSSGSWWSGYSWGNKSKKSSVSTSSTKTSGDYLTGYKDGSDAGYELGFEDGYADALEEYNINPNSDLNDSDVQYVAGYTAGYRDAEMGVPFDVDASILSDEARDNPTSEYNIGFSDGRDAGYSEGFEAGYTRAHEEVGIDVEEGE